MLISVLMLKVQPRHKAPVCAPNPPPSASSHLKLPTSPFTLHPSPFKLQTSSPFKLHTSPFKLQTSNFTLRSGCKELSDIDKVSSPERQLKRVGCPFAGQAPKGLNRCAPNGFRVLVPHPDLLSWGRPSASAWWSWAAWSGVCSRGGFKPIGTRGRYSSTFP